MNNFYLKYFTSFLLLFSFFCFGKEVSLQPSQNSQEEILIEFFSAQKSQMKQGK